MNMCVLPISPTKRHDTHQECTEWTCYKWCYGSLKSALANSAERFIRSLPDDCPQHDRCCKRQPVPVEFQQSYLSLGSRAAKAVFLFEPQSKLRHLENTYHVKMYWVWLFLRLTSAARPTGIPLASRLNASTISGTKELSVISEINNEGQVDVPIVCSIQIG